MANDPQRQQQIQQQQNPQHKKPLGQRPEGPAKYTVTADEPGLQIAGLGSFTTGEFAGCSIIKPGGSLLVHRAGWEPRASLYPENDAALWEFEAKRRRVERDAREAIGNNIDPRSGDPILPGSLDATTIEKIIAGLIAKVGPNPKRDLNTSKPKRAHLEDGLLSTGPAPRAEALRPSASSVRASDQQ